MYSAYCFERDAWNGTPAHALEIMGRRRERLAHLSNLIDYTRVDPSVAFAASTSDSRTRADGSVGSASPST
jgi:hypothetical protein